MNGLIYHELGHVNQKQRYFGDWILYNNHLDVGYYLGAKLIQHISKYGEFDKLISFGIEEVKYYYQTFVEEEIVVLLN